MKIFFSVGEPSGDHHAAALIEEIQYRNPECECIGYGGPHMEQAGCRVLYPLTNLAVMGIMQVLPLLFEFIRVGFRAKKIFREERPDAVVLVDFPGFNWWIAKFAKQQGIPVFFYMPPQLWAWGGWRVKRVQKYVDYVLTGLEFEQQWYQERGVNAVYVGHPFFEHVQKTPIDHEEVRLLRQNHRQVVGVLPGSRTMEVKHNWPTMQRLITYLSARHPECQFLVANYKDHHREFCEAEIAKSETKLPIKFFTGKTSEIIEAADFCLMVSGSVSLELLARRTPSVVMYYCTWTFTLVARMVVNVKYMTLTNLMVNRMMVPEYHLDLWVERKIAQMMHVMDQWLSDESVMQAVQAEMDQLADRVVTSNSSGKTADFLLEKLSEPVLTQRAA